MTEQLKLFPADNHRERVFEAVKGYEAGRKIRKHPARSIGRQRTQATGQARAVNRVFMTM